MSDKRFFELNLELSSEFSRYLIAHPEISKRIDPDSEIIFLIDSDPELTKYNLGLAGKIREESGKVLFVHIKTLLPKEASRLVEPHLETTLK